MRSIISGVILLFLLNAYASIAGTTDVEYKPDAAAKFLSDAISVTQSSATTKETTGQKVAALKKSRDEIMLYWQQKIDTVKDDGPYEDCSFVLGGHFGGAEGGRAGVGDCIDRGDQIELFRKEMERELASLSCPAGSQIEFSRDLEAIKEVLSTYLDNSGAVNEQFDEFRDITERSTQCGKIKVTAVYTMEQFRGFAGFPRTREAVLIKTNNKFNVSRVGDWR